jgi:flavorubredoxin
LSYLKGLKPKKKLGVAFGWCGWGGGAVREINKTHEQIGFELIDELEVKFKPNEEDLKTAFDLGVRIAEAVMSE